MKIPLEYQIISLIGFLFLLVGHWFWCLKVAYPIVLEGFIKKGRSWLYLPLRWKGFYKFAVLFWTRLQYLLVPAAGFWSLWVWTPKIRLEIQIGASLAFAILFYFLTRYLLHVRFKQQLDSYFFTRGKLHHQYVEKSHKMTEQEVDNLTSFQHQSILREADRRGQLTRTIASQSAKVKRESKKK